jgi:rhamnulokinase
MLEEIHRFPNGPMKIGDHLHWDVLALFEEIKTGLRKAGAKAALSSLGVDTWGVDFALLDQEEVLISQPFHYRDPHTNGVMEQVFSLVDRREIFERTGVQFMQINSLYQLYALKESPILDKARTFLMMPDLFNFWLSGQKRNEYTIATTTQFYNPHQEEYDQSLLGHLSLPQEIYPEIVPAGTILGSLDRGLQDETGLSQILVIAPACHDTASAVAAVPIESARAAYISSGTWSLVGVEIPKPVITAQSLADNFTNEGGVDDTVRLLKNVTGLWLAQECRRIWSANGEHYDWDEIAQLAEDAPAFTCFIDPDHPNFLNPDDMPKAICRYCASTGQPIPENHSALLRCVFESLALKYRWVLSRLEALLGEAIDIIHIIGGGCQNRLLCQMTADAAGKRVLAGPIEATAIGNSLMQAIALGYIDSLAEGRKLVARSFPLIQFQPISTAEWDQAYERFKSYLA